MKHLALIVLFVASLSVCLQAQARLELKNKTVKDNLLVEILNDSEMKELKPPSPTGSAVFLRLFSIGELGDCAPEAETEVTCSFRYYLAVSDGGLGVPRRLRFRRSRGNYKDRLAEKLCIGRSPSQIGNK